jgi:membrane fusion protein, multidrug efflux system
MRRISYTTAVFFLILLISCSSGKKNKNKTDPGVPVNTTIVKKQRLTYYDAYPATVVALKEVELRAEVGGSITWISFTEGQSVKKGQKLYEIDRRRYEATYNQAKANLSIAEQNHEKTQRDANRYIELNKEDAIAKQRLDYALTDLKNAESQVISAKADLEKAKTDLDYSIITAPFDGTVGISLVRMGALVSPDQTLMNIISSDNPMGADIEVEQKEMGKFQLLAIKNMTPEDSTFRIKLPDNSIYRYYGKINIIDRNVDPQTATIKVRLSFPNPDKALRPGMKCSAKVLNQNSGMQLVIPNKAVVEQMSEYFVFKVDSMKAKQVKVIPGQKIEGDIIIREGLNEGDQIVVDGIQRLHDGAPVNKINEQQTGPKNPGEKQSKNGSSEEK